MADRFVMGRVGIAHRLHTAGVRPVGNAYSTICALCVKSQGTWEVAHG